ncbi:hypothetical protein QYF36_015781 [Acer negundo]|nr:hypothetical protein QYF36_015781 [Acer negundo]
MSCSRAEHKTEYLKPLQLFRETMKRTYYMPSAVFLALSFRDEYVSVGYSDYSYLTADLFGVFPRDETLLDKLEWDLEGIIVSNNNSVVPPGKRCFFTPCIGKKTRRGRMKRERSSARWYSREHHPQNSCSECIKSDDVLYNSRIEDFVQISSSKQCAKNKMKVDIKLEGGIIYSQNPWEEKSNTGKYTLLIIIPIHESCSDQICIPFCEVETVTVSGPLRKAPDMQQLLLRILLEFRQYAVTSSSVNEISIRNAIYACFLIRVA